MNETPTMPGAQDAAQPEMPGSDGSSPVAGGPQSTAAPADTTVSASTPGATNPSGHEPATATASSQATPTEATPSQEGPTANEPVQPSAQEVAEAAFGALGLGAETLRAIVDLGYGTPTPIQEQTIPLMLSGRDLIAQAPTGTGKTAAYGLPIVQRIDEDVLAPQALIVVPTRELAIQVAEALHTFGRFREVVTLPIYGGAPYERQLRALARGVQIVVGTPGRLLDHLNRGTLVLSGLRTVVLDEADEMLDMGFIEDIEAILAAMPEERQTALFSATIPPRVASLAQRYMREPARVSVAAREAVAPRVRQVYYEVPASAKPEALSRILDLEQPESAIVFVRTRRDADEVAERLNGQGYLAQAIHGEISQGQRERTLDRFRAGHTQLLVATDVAARGLDIPDVSHVINYDLPLDAESYVHRIGRTGRAGRAGEALTLVTPRERRLLQMIERAIHRQIERLRLPTIADVAARRRAAFRDEIMGILDAGELDPYLHVVEDLAGNHDPAAIAAAAFKMAAQAQAARRPGWTNPWTVPEPKPEAAREPREAREEGEERGARGARAGRARREAPGREVPGMPSLSGPMVRLFLRVGREDGVRPTDLVGAIANESGLPGDAIGDIDIYDAFSFVEVPEGAADAVRSALNGTTIRGRRPQATLARPSDEYPAASARPARQEARPGRGALRIPYAPRRGYSGRAGAREGRGERGEGSGGHGGRRGFETRSPRAGRGSRPW